MYMMHDSTLRAAGPSTGDSVCFTICGGCLWAELYYYRVTFCEYALWVSCTKYRKLLSFQLSQTAALKVCCWLSPRPTTSLLPFKACMQNSPFLSMQHLHFQLSALQHRHLVCAVSRSTEPQHKTLPSLIHYFLKQCKWVNNFSTFNHRHNSQVWVRIQVLESKSHFDI